MTLVLFLAVTSIPKHICSGNLFCYQMLSLKGKRPDVCGRMTFLNNVCSKPKPGANSMGQVRSKSIQKIKEGLLKVENIINKTETHQDLL